MAYHLRRTHKEKKKEKETPAFLGSCSAQASSTNNLQNTLLQYKEKVIEHKQHGSEAL